MYQVPQRYQCTSEAGLEGISFWWLTFPEQLSLYRIELYRHLARNLWEVVASEHSLEI